MSKEIELLKNENVLWEKAEENEKEMYFPYVLDGEGEKVFFDNATIKSYYEEDGVIFTVGGEKCSNLKSMSYYYKKNIKTKNKKPKLNKALGF